MNNLGLSILNPVQIIYNYENSIIEKIYFVDAAYKADLKIFFVDAAYKAKWEDKSKIHLLY